MTWLNFGCFMLGWFSAWVVFGWALKKGMLSKRAVRNSPYVKIGEIEDTL